MLLDDRKQQAAPTPEQAPRFPPVIEDRPGKTLIVEDRPGKEPLSWGQTIGGTAASVGLPIVGGILGGPPGAIGLGVIGELLRQGIQNEDPSLKLAALEGGLNVIPGGKAAKTVVGNVLKRGAFGAGLGTAGEVPREYFRSGEAPSVEQALTQGALGGAVGGTIGGAEKLAPAIARALRPGATPEAPAAPLIIEDRPGRAPIVSRETPPTAQGNLFDPRRSVSRQDAPGTTQAAAVPVATPQVPIVAPEAAPTAPRPESAPVPATRSVADQAASPEAISRIGGEKARGVKFVRQRIVGGEPQELPATVDRVDIQPTGDEVIYRVEGGKVTPERLGPDATMDRAKQRAAQIAAKPTAAKPTSRTVEGPTGRETDVFGITDPTKRYRMRFRAVPIDDLGVNVAGVQTRQRDRFAAQSQVDDLARTFDPDRYLAGNAELDRGVPIIGPDRAVESGNGRVAALRKMRAEDPARFGQVISRQQERAAEFGLRPEDIGPDTLVVRERISPVDRQAFVDEANARTGIGMAPVETATQDARRLEGANMLDLQVGESQTIDQALLSPRNRGVIAKFLATFPPNERNSVVTADGTGLNPSGVQRLKAAILANTYQGDAGDRLVRAATESTDTGVKNVESAIFASLGKVSKAMDLVRSGARAQDLDIADDIATVTGKLAQLRSEGQSVDEFLRTGGLFGRELTPFQETLLDQFDAMSRSGKRIRRLIEGLADEVVASPSPGQGTLLGGKVKVDKEALLAAARNRAGETGLFGDVGAAGRGPRRPTGRPGTTGEQDAPRRPSGLGFGRVPPKVPGASAEPPPPNIQKGRLSAADPDRLTKSLNEGLGSPADIERLRNGIAEQIRDNVEFARRGKVPIDETFREARQFGVEHVLDRKRGEAWNAAELVAARRVNETQLGNLRTAWQKAHTSRADEDRIELMRQVYLTHAVLQQNAGASAEAGRALQIHSQFKKDPQLKAIQRAMERAGGADNIDQVIDDLARFDPDDVAAMSRYVGKLAKATIWDKAHEWFLASLVSGTQTHMAQAIGNAAYALERPLMKIAQVGVDVVRSAVTNTDRQRFLGEVGVDLIGMARGLRQGVPAALKVLANDDAQGRLDQPIRQAIGGTIGKIVRTPLRALAAGDELFKAVNVQGHLAALAYRQASKEGRKGQAHADRMAEIIFRPDAIEGLRNELEREALYRTFQQEGGRFTKSAIGMRRSTIIGPFVVPFIKTPVNVFKASVERSPLALIDILKRVNDGTLHGAALTDDLTKAAVGTAIGGAVAVAVAEGNVTGFGPSDPKERAAWRLTHQPYSFKVPKAAQEALGLKSQWINYGRIEPWGTTIGWAADVATLIQKPDTEVEDAVSKASFLLARGIVSKTWMQGVSGFFGAMDDDGGKGGQLERFLHKLGGALAVPNVIAQTARAYDPVMRKPRTIGEVLQSRAGLGAGIPGYLEEVGPIRDVFGGAVVIPGGPVERAISPIYRSLTRDEDPARREVAEHGVAPGSPQRQLGGVKLTPKEYDGYVERSGQLAYRMISRLVRQPGYLRMADEDKEDALQRAFSEARASEREKLKPQVLLRARREGIFPKKKAAR